jgi:hypothetical protein
MLHKRDHDCATSEPIETGTTMQIKERGKVWKWLLILPYLAMLWIPSYNASDPTWMGFPFFYWYQLLWVLICSAIIAVVYAMTKP